VKDLVAKCRKTFSQSSIDKRTSYFAGFFSDDLVVHRLQDGAWLSSEQIEELLRDFSSDRYADYFERREKGWRHAPARIDLILSQGFKRGLKWRGVPLGKTCWDICIYQQLLQDLRSRTLIEIGTGLGGSALFFLDHCRMFGLDTQIITLDINVKDVSRTVRSEEGIEFIGGDIAQISKLLPAKRLRQLPHPWLVVEDRHVQIPLIVRHMTASMAKGDYLIIEDIGFWPDGGREVAQALGRLPKKSLMVDTHYTDLFGRNATCSPDMILRRM
jgi:cephalosporin hydroxylase